MSKKESFVKGTLILAVAALIARVLGIFQRVPLEHMFDDIGNAAFAQANNVYLMLLTLATAGIPSTLSKMVSERYALERPDEARQVYRAALIFAAVTGVFMSVILYIAAPWFASHAKVPQSTRAIQAIAPALLLFPSIAMMRGYLQGRNNMMAGGISQIVEQFARVSTAILLAFILLRQGYSNSIMAAGASFGSVLGSIAAFGVMITYTIRMRKKDRLDESTITIHTKLPLLQIYKDIFSLSIPIVLSSMTIQVVYFIDSSLIVPLLSGQIGEIKAMSLLGILGQKAQSIAGIPPVLAIALSTSLIPIISAAFARKDNEFLKKQVTLALRIAILTGTPIVMSLVVAAHSLNGLLFSQLTGTSMIALLTLGTIFQITMTTSNSILLGIGKARISMYYVVAGITTKLIFSVLLSRFIGIYGIIIATTLCFILITFLNLRLLKTIVPFKVMGNHWISFTLVVLISGGIGYGVNEVGTQLIDLMPARLAYLITSILVGIAIVSVYLILLIIFGIIDKKEVASYPLKLQRLLNPLMRLQRVYKRENDR